MTVAELIDALSEFSEDSQVLLVSPNGQVSTIVLEDLVQVMTDGKQVMEGEQDLRRAWPGVLLNGLTL